MSAPHVVHVLTPATRSRTLRCVTGQQPTARHLHTGQLACFAGIVLGVSVFLAAPAAYAAQGPVGLGTAGSFAVLAGSGITNTGPTTITGDVGTFPTPSESGFGSITLIGTNHDGDAVTQGAKNDLVTAYNDAAGRTPATNVAVELGGSTLFAGVYTSPTLGLTGTLTLDAQHNPNAEFVFQASSTLIAETNSRVVLLNGADPCHVVWQVGSSATFKTGTQFVGDVLAQTSVTAQTGATFQGRLLARNGAVTLDTNTITNSSCQAPTTSGTPTTSSATTTTSPAGASTTPTAVALPTAGTPASTATAPPHQAAPSATSAGTVSALAGSGPRGSAGVPRAIPGAPASRTSLPFTGLNTLGLVATGLALIALGVLTSAAGRRNRTG